MTALIAFALFSSGIQVHQDGGRAKFGGYFMDNTIVTTGDRGGAVGHDVEVCQTEPQWEKLRKTLGIPDDKNRAFFELHGPLGAMDWGREQVVFVRVGERPTAGFKVSMYNLTMQGHDTWQVALTVSPPPKGMMVAEVLTNPYIVFRMRRAKGMPKLVIHKG